MILYNAISKDLRAARAVHPTGDDQEAIADWCQGYLDGTRMDEEWGDDDLAIVSLLPFAVLAGEMTLEGEEDNEGRVIEDASSHIEKYCKELPYYVLEQHRYWIQWRHENTDAPLQEGISKVGRNDECPCGSGRKYKKCCAN